MWCAKALKHGTIPYKIRRREGEFAFIRDLEVKKQWFEHWLEWQIYSPKLYRAHGKPEEWSLVQKLSWNPYAYEYLKRMGFYV